jgi:hypothetical protein
LRFLLIFSPRWLFFYPGLALLLLGAALSILLLPGPVYITPSISLDIHTFLVSAVTILIGRQWADAGFGSLQYGAIIRVLTVSITGIALALQLAFTAFLSAIIEVEI